MFGLFKRKKGPLGLPELTDLNGDLIQEGDVVDALRYNLGRCKLLVVDDSYIYESLSGGKQISWLRMIDASTDCQKVLKVQE